MHPLHPHFGWHPPYLLVLSRGQWVKKKLEKLLDVVLEVGGR